MKRLRFYTGKGGVIFPIRTSTKGGYRPKVVKEKAKWAHEPRKKNRRMSRVAKRR